jgi:LDH2 family malate/lactate/ureidoglycolate dehydrogenase
MRLTIAEARSLLEASMATIDYAPEEAALIADHLLDCELRGLPIGGVSRAASLVDRYRGRTQERQPITVTRETPFSAVIRGGGHAGPLVAYRAAELAIEKAKQTKIGVVGAVESVYTGMLSYYMEMATRANFMAMAAGSSASWVAPHGGVEGRFGTNPIAFGFPSAAAPIIYDIGTSNIMVADAVLHERQGLSLPEGMAFDEDGRPTCDPAEALRGALTVWGGHKGSGLALVAQLLGMLCGAPADPPRRESGIGFFMLVLDPELLTDAEDFRSRVAAYADWLRTTKPLEAGKPVRVPFDRSREARTRRLDEGAVEVPDVVYEALVQATRTDTVA